MPELSISSYSLTALGSNATDIIKSEIKDDCLSLSPTAVVSECSESGVTDISECVPDLPKGKFLTSIYFVLNNGLVFTDKVLPDPSKPLISKNIKYSSNYYTDLFIKVSSFNTYNHLGARVPLKHSNLRVEKFRQMLPYDYDDRVVLQYIEFGFPLGLQDDYILQPVLKNHSSAYDFYTHVDKFVTNELEKGGMTGPFSTSPFNNIMISPLMTSPKKPKSRRCVFDASFSEYSLNMNTPDKHYLGDEYDFTFPKLDDFGQLILKYGKKCFFMEERSS